MIRTMQQMGTLRKKTSRRTRFSRGRNRRTPLKGKMIACGRPSMLHCAYPRTFTSGAYWRSTLSHTNFGSRTGVVDGRKVVFELRTNITQLPKTSRQERLTRKHEIINSNRTHMEQRIRLWLMRFSVLQLSITFLAAFVAMCVAYAGLFYALEEGCCGDSEMLFTDTFAFSVQTAATIGASCLIYTSGRD